MIGGAVHLRYSDRIATITFDRESARNAMTWSMYAELMAHCREIQSLPAIRAVVFRGAGGKAFVSGTDIRQFPEFRSGDDGVAYERRIDECLGLIEAFSMPTVAVIEGWATGGGLLMASACDFRIATLDARFAVPIATTVGNTLSMGSMARLLHVWGPQRTRRMLLLAEAIGAQEAFGFGFLHRACGPSELDAELAALTERLVNLAPITQSVVKKALRRIVVDNLPDGDDLVREAYGSSDFKEGVQAFLERRTPHWTGR